MGRGQGKIPENNLARLVSHCQALMIYGNYQALAAAGLLTESPQGPWLRPVS